MMRNIYRLLKINRFIHNSRLKFAALLAADIVGIRHLSVRIDPVMACNLRCQMCYFSDSVWRNNNKGIMSQRDIERVATLLFPKALQLVVGCAAEPTLYPDFLEIVRLGKRSKVPYISLVTNGQLLSQEHIRQMVNLGLDELMLSTHGVRRATYEALMTNASYEKHIDFLRFLVDMKKTAGSKLPRLRINYTANPDNLEELGDFFSVYGEYDIAALQIRPIMDFGQTAYQKKDMEPYLGQYANVVQRLSKECKHRGIILMATISDPTYRSENPSSSIVDYVRRHVTPTYVWKPDFQWREETYEQYCARSGWRRHLIGRILSKKCGRASAKDRRRMTYDVQL
jgi:MoaA/NifB/PqqE/SkfB family radical SAM enzyme